MLLLKTFISKSNPTGGDTKPHGGGVLPLKENTPCKIKWSYSLIKLKAHTQRRNHSLNWLRMNWERTERQAADMRVLATPRLGGLTFT
jgi:hypothetical protein